MRNYLYGECFSCENLFMDELLYTGTCKLGIIPDQWFEIQGSRENCYKYKDIRNSFYDQSKYISTM